MKYKVTVNGTETLCDKVTIDGFDYYVSDEGVVNPCYFYNKPTNYLGKALRREGIFWVCENIEGSHLLSEAKKVIATNHPFINVPKVVDKVEELANKFGYHDRHSDTLFREGLTKGYNKSQETHPYSEEDVKGILDWITRQDSPYSVMYGEPTFRFATNDKDVTIKEVVDAWKSQRTITIHAS